MEQATAVSFAVEVANDRQEIGAIPDEGMVLYDRADVEGMALYIAMMNAAIDVQLETNKPFDLSALDRDHPLVADLQGMNRNWVHFIARGLHN